MDGVLCVMDVRRKPVAPVVADALKMARIKQQQGCRGCAEQYAAVAARHGATRRDFLKAGVGGLAALALAGAAGLTINIKPAEAYYYWCYAGDWVCACDGLVYAPIICCEAFPNGGGFCYVSWYEWVGLYC